MNVGERAGASVASDLFDKETTKILLVDDRRENLISLGAALEPLGQEIVTASTGREALRAALDEDFAVILLDVRLPEIDGFEAAHLLRGRPRTKYTPIIFLTAIDKDDQKVSKGYALGAVDYIFKPADPDILRSKVSVFIELYRKSRQIERLNATLEARVEDRTRELEAANRELQCQIAERRRAESEVRALNEDLEARVRERTRELETLNEELRAFSYSVSHDLRAPLRRIESFSDLLMEDYGSDLDEAAVQYLERILRSSRHMSALITDLLKLSRISREQMECSDVDISELAWDVIEDYRSSEPERSVEVHVDPGLHAHGDKALLRVMLDNLIGNAWKFTSARSEARIEVLATQVGDEAGFCIRDNGAGFDMEFADRLFQPFQRLHGSSEFPGTGVGLAIVHRIVRRHGGMINADAEVDKGAAFTVSLPTR